MSFRVIDVDHNLRERLVFDDKSFPVGLCFDDYSMFANGTINCHWHNAFEFALLLSGEVDYYINDMYMVLKPGDCAFVNVNAMHISAHRNKNENTVMFTLVFPSSLFGGNVDSTIYSNYFQPVMNSTLQGFKVEGTKQGQIITKCLYEISALNTSEHGYELQCLSLLTKLWHATVTYIGETEEGLSGTNLDRRYEQRAKKILSFIHSNYSENITVQDIADETGISRSECFRCLKRVTNKNPVEYINEYRLTQASRFLLETDESITEIYSSCGFGSSSYFGKLFKDTFGVTPAQYRKSGRKQHLNIN